MKLLTCLMAACWLLTKFTTAAASEADGSARTMSIADGIETTRAMTDSAGRSVFVSPDGRQYAVLLIRGDVAADGIRVELAVGRLESIDGSRPRIVSSLFTNGLGVSSGFGDMDGAPALTQPWANVPKWLDNRHVAILWPDDQGVTQVLSIDVATAGRTYLTKSRTNVTNFVPGPDGVLLYDARRAPPREPSQQMRYQGFAVTNPELLSLIAGFVDGTSSLDFAECDRFVMTRDWPSTRRVVTPPMFCAVSYLSGVAVIAAGGQDVRISQLFSPDRRHVLLNASVPDVPAGWHQFDDDSLAAMLRERESNPRGLYSRMLQRLVVLDLNTGDVRPLWDVPVNRMRYLHVAWNPSGRSVLVWPTFLPRSVAQEAGRAAGRIGAALAEVELDTGNVRPIAIPESTEVSELDFTNPDTAEVHLTDGQLLHFKRDSSAWVRLRTTGSGHQSRKERTSDKSRIVVELREDMNTPPALFAIERRTRQEQRIFDLNPDLGSRIKLGRVTFIHWTDELSRHWKGRLYYPVHYQEGKQYPLVIQTHGFAKENEFSIYGPAGSNAAPGLGPGWSVYLAQALAAQDIAVLVVGSSSESVEDDSLEGPADFKNVVTGWEGAISYLERAGLVQSRSVGIMGHSATGRYVEFALVNSKLQFAAAIAGDYADANYGQALLLGWPEFSAELNGSPAFGTGMTKWLENAPAFNLDRVHTPLQLQVTSSMEGAGNLIQGWEVFSRLRYLRKPVEYFVVPDLMHGSHGLQNPRQLLILQTRALDWWCFWLKGMELPGAQKQQQYAEWHRLRDLHQADVAKNPNRGATP